MAAKCTKCGRTVPERARCMYCGGALEPAPVERHVLVIGPEVADPVAAIQAKIDELRAGAAALPPSVRATRFEAAKQKIKSLLDGNHHAAAIGVIDEALALEPGAAHLHVARGLCLGALRKHADALACFDAAAATEPRLADAWFHKADYLEVLGRLDESLAAYDRAITIDPDHAQAWCDRGHVLNRLQRPADALVSFDKAVAINPRLAAAWFNKAGAELAAGRRADAARSFERFIALADPAAHGGALQRARELLAQLTAG